MATPHAVRIGGGGGFYGDRLVAPIELLQTGELDYLIIDYLAELTMSILAKQRSRDRHAGWATDLMEWLGAGGIQELRKSSTRLITNAGGAHPEACAKIVLALAIESGWDDCRVGVVTGDDLMPYMSTLIDSGARLNHMEDGDSITSVLDKLASANAYIGAGPIARALERGADIVITGRVADASLTVGPMVHEIGWAARAEAKGLPLCGPIENWAPEADAALVLIASWTIAGHLIECGAQVTGGNATDWNTQPDLGNLGYPIACVDIDGGVLITKPPASGGRLDRLAVAEQLVYEIGDPAAYPTPDVVVDMRAIELDEVEDGVRMKGALGQPRPEQLKISASFSDGWFASSSLLVPGPDTLARAQRLDETIRTRLDAVGLIDLEVHTEFHGSGTTLPPGLEIEVNDPPEILIRWAVRSASRRQVVEFGREVAPLVLTGPAGVSGYGARPRPRAQFRFWPALIERSHVEPRVALEILDSRLEDLPRPVLTQLRLWLGQVHSFIEHELTDRLERLQRNAPEGRTRRIASAVLERLKGGGRR